MAVLNFFEHLENSDQTYLVHLKFAWTVAFYMLFSFCFLLIHGLLPFIPIPKLFNISGMTRKMKKWDNYIIVKKLRKGKH